jgi:hypothetical protein
VAAGQLLSTRRYFKRKPYQAAAEGTHPCGSWTTALSQAGLEDALCTVLRIRDVSDPNFFPSWTPDPGSKISGSNPDPHPHKRIKVFSKWFLSSLKYDPGTGMFIPDPNPGPDLHFLPIPDPRVKKAPDPGSETLLLCSCFRNSPQCGSWTAGISQLSSWATGRDPEPYHAAAERTHQSVAAGQLLSATLG